MLLLTLFTGILSCLSVCLYVVPFSRLLPDYTAIIILYMDDHIVLVSFSLTYSWFPKTVPSVCTLPTVQQVSERTVFR